MPIELRQLRAFVEIARSGSFSRAASLLSIAQPALSRQVRLLEAELAAPLFHRNGRGAVLTPAGERLLGHAEDVLRRVAEARRDLAALQEQPAGAVALGIPPSVAVALLTPLVVHMRDRYPGVRLHVMEGFSGTVVDWIETGRADLGITYDIRRSPLILTEMLLVEELFLVRRPDPEGCSPATIRGAALAAVPLVLPARPHGLRLLCERVMGQQGHGLDIRFEIDSMPTMKELAETGVAATVLPFGAVAREVAAGRLEALRIVEPGIRRTMVLATAAQRPIDAPLRAVITAIQAVIAHRSAAA